MDGRRPLAGAIEITPQQGDEQIPSDRPPDARHVAAIAIAPGDSAVPPSGSEIPPGSEPFGDTLRLASDTAVPPPPDVPESLHPSLAETLPASLPSGVPSSGTASDKTTDFQVGSRPQEFFGLPSDFTPGMSVKVAPANLVGTDKLVLRGFVVQPRGAKSEFPPDYTLVAGPFMGGMGKVFRAQQGSLRRDVAIKQIHDELRGNDEERKKFVTEAVITGELEHPNIIPIHDLGLTKDFAQSGDQTNGNDADLFYTMKFVEGDDWKEELPKLSEAENIDVLLKVADAISFAHSRNIIHRDLKPSNIRLGKFGEVLVMDWGLAARLDAPNDCGPPARRCTWRRRWRSSSSPSREIRSRSCWKEGVRHHGRRHRLSESTVISICSERSYSKSSLSEHPTRGAPEKSAFKARPGTKLPRPTSGANY